MDPLESYCPVCQRQILPKRLIIPVDSSQPHPPAPPPSSPDDSSGESFFCLIHLPHPYRPRSSPKTGLGGIKFCPSLKERRHSYKATTRSRTRHRSRKTQRGSQAHSLHTLHHHPRRSARSHPTTQDAHCHRPISNPSLLLGRVPSRGHHLPLRPSLLRLQPRPRFLRFSSSPSRPLKLPRHPIRLPAQQRDRQHLDSQLLPRLAPTSFVLLQLFIRVGFSMSRRRSPRREVRLPTTTASPDRSRAGGASIASCQRRRRVAKWSHDGLPSYQGCSFSRRRSETLSVACILEGAETNPRLDRRKRCLAFFRLFLLSASLQSYHSTVRASSRLQEHGRIASSFHRRVFISRPGQHPDRA